MDTKSRPTRNLQDDEAQALVAQYGTYCTYLDASEMTTVSVRTLKRETAAGRLPCYRIGHSRTLRLKTVDVVALIRRVA